MTRSTEAQMPLSAVPAQETRPCGVASPDLERELVQALRDFEQGDYIELTPEQLERCVATGESPWPDESHD